MCSTSVVVQNFNGPGKLSRYTKAE